MKLLPLAVLLISINLSSFVNASPIEDEHRSLQSSKAAAETIEKYTCKSILAIGKIHEIGIEKEGQIADETVASNVQGRRSLRKQDGNDAKGKTRNKSIDPDEDFVCELEDGSVIPIEASDEQLREMRFALRDGSLVSQVSTMDVDITTEAEEGDVIEPKGKSSKGKKAAKLPPGQIKLQMKTKARKLTEQAQRRLGTLFRTNRMLVILVHDKDGRKPPLGANETSDKIFGIYGDLETPSVQLSGCSNNQTSLTPDSGDPDVNALMDAPGVVEVKLGISIQPFDGPLIENAAIEAAEQKLGISLPGVFDFVAIVIEDCLDSNECGFAAYAYLNSWKSLFIKAYLSYPAIVTHELGHNINFGHSGVLTTYDDWSCSMGNPLWDDHLDKMCFNPAKNWQLAHQGAWYAEHKLLLDPWTRPFSSHKLVGVSEYDLIESSYPTALAVLKLETHTSTDFFVGFNRANNQNADNRLASNQVTLIKAGNNGEGYSESKFIIGLKQGESYSIPNFGGSREELTITVDEIVTSSSPGYADVSIVLGDGSFTPAPTPYCDGKWLKVTVNTDNYPTETSWEVIQRCDRDEIVMSVSGGQYTEVEKRYEEMACVPNSQYEFSIYDKYGDGLCCSYGSGAYSVEFGADVVVSGGEFERSETATFGSCETVPTTAQPTNKPTTSSPTKAPTSPPPSAKPTPEPTAQPTNFPTKVLGTSSPTALRTAAPTPQPTAEDDSDGGIAKTYTTPNVGEATKSSKGVMFTITAKSQDVNITAIGIIGKDAKKSDVKVYSHAGVYEDFSNESDREGKGKGKGKGKGTRGRQKEGKGKWDEHFKDKVMLDPQEIVDIALDEKITIPAGDTVSVYVVSKKGLAYKIAESDEFDQFAVSDDFILNVGTATKKEFKQPDNLADFVGRLVYRTFEIVP